MKYILINRSEHISIIARYNLNGRRPTIETGVRINHENMNLKEMNGLIIQANFENGTKDYGTKVFKIGKQERIIEAFDEQFGFKTTNTAIKINIPVAKANTDPTNCTCCNLCVCCRGNLQAWSSRLL